jgi:ferritin-like metal-binding protein YciE
MLDRRREQGTGLIERIEDALEEMQASKARQKNVIAEALIEDVNERLDDIEEETLIEPFVLAAVQKTQHYCIAAWGAAAALARLLGEDEVVRTMEQALDEGKRFDEEMTKLAEGEINPRMLDENGAEDEEAEDGDDEEGEGSSSSDKRRERVGADQNGNGRRKAQAGGGRR